MAKRNQEVAGNNGNDEVTVGTGTMAEAPAVNRTLVYRRDHPQNRSSYGIEGRAGIIVFDRSLFADGQPPATIEVDCVMVSPKADTKTAKAELAAAKALEKAAKAQAKIDSQKAKAEEKAQKAQAALEAAQKKVADAAAAAAAKLAAEGVATE